MNNHLVNHIKHSELKCHNTLHVLGVIQNPVRYHSRYRLFREWVREMLQTPHVKLYVVEAVYGDREPECAPECGEYEYLQVSTDSEIWLKENLQNIGIAQLFPTDWKYACMSDCDIHFRNPNWAQESVHQLQHYNVIQPWSDVADLNFFGEIHGHWKSFGGLCAKRKKMWHGKGHNGYDYGHTGMAWCYTRYFYENIGKFLDFCIVGAGDHHQAWACLGMVKETIHQGMCKDYYDACEEWQRKAEFACADIVGFVPGRIEHHFHGPKERRRYWGRWDILIDNNFNPKTDLAYDSQGVLVLCGSNKYQLEHDIMAYNRQRLEDSIEQY